MPFNSDDQDAMRAIKRPYFSRTYTTTANINASAVSVERFISEEHEFQHAPCDTILIVNLDAVPLGIRMDGSPDNYIPVAAGGTVSASDQLFRNFTIENLSGSTGHTAGTVKIIVQRTKPKPGEI